MDGHDLKSNRDSRIPDDVGHLLAHVKGHHLPYQEIVQNQKTLAAASRWSLMQEALEVGDPESPSTTV
jgi:hypothetical protein